MRTTGLRNVTWVAMAACGICLGCSEEPTGGGKAAAGGSKGESAIPEKAGSPPVLPGASGMPTGIPIAGPDAGQPPAAETSKPVPVPVKDGIAELSPENSRIIFVGTHVGEKPDPRTGGFTKFTGRAEVDEEKKALKSISVEIDIDSVWTQFPALTTHLKSPDFFNVREFPTAKYETTGISAILAGEFAVSGQLTLMNETKPVPLHSVIRVTDEGLYLKGSVSFDRTVFGMDKLTERVEKDVLLTVIIGEKTDPSAGASSGGGFGAPGGPGMPGFGGGGGRGGGGNFNPAEIFKNRDADGDGKLTGDEITDRMKQNLKEIDTDGDGAITLEEFEARMRQFRGGPGGPGGGPPGGGRPPGGPPAEASKDQPAKDEPRKDQDKKED